jgi:hypothetical protein
LFWEKQARVSISSLCMSVWAAASSLLVMVLLARFGDLSWESGDGDLLT